jgi:MGT family glycosyltransferase
MGTFLFTSQPAMGHLNSLLTIARYLRERGHTPVFVCHGPKSMEEAVVKNGSQVVRMRPSLTSIGLILLPFTSGFFETCFALRLFFSGLTHYANAVGAVIDDIKPEAVVSDFGFPAGCLAAETRNIPGVAVYSAGLFFKGPGIPPPGTGLPIGEAWGETGARYASKFRSMEQKIDRAFTRARHRLRLPPAGTGLLSLLSSPWLTLILTSEAAEAPRAELPATGYFIGPCFSGRESDQTSDFPFDKFSSDKPKVYVSLGTVFNKKPAAFNRIINGFADGSCQLIVSAGGAFERLSAQKPPDQVLLFKRVPQTEVLPRVDAVISHGGNNTVNETLAAGKPLLVMPVGGEQGDNASRVVFLGAGLRADLNEATSEEIYGKVKRLIDEPDFKRRSSDIAEALSKTQGPLTAIRLIEHIAKTGAPLPRPEGYPPTITMDSPMPWEFKKPAP